MENQNAPIKPIAYNYGIYLALLNIAVLIIMYALSLDKSWVISILSILLTIALFVNGIKAYKLSNNNLLSLGQAVKTGLAIAVIGGLITALYSYFHYEFIYPEFIEMQREAGYQQMTERNMSEEDINKAMEINDLFMNSTFFAMMSIIGSLLFGLIISFITGLIMRNDK